MEGFDQADTTLTKFECVELKWGEATATIMFAVSDPTLRILVRDAAYLALQRTVADLRKAGGTEAASITRLDFPIDQE